MATAFEAIFVGLVGWVGRGDRDGPEKRSTEGFYSQESIGNSKEGWRRDRGAVWTSLEATARWLWKKFHSVCAESKVPQQDLPDAPTPRVAEVKGRRVYIRQNCEGMVVLKGHSDACPTTHRRNDGGRNGRPREAHRVLLAKADALCSCNDGDNNDVSRSDVHRPSVLDARGWAVIVDGTGS